MNLHIAALNIGEDSLENIPAFCVYRLHFLLTQQRLLFPCYLEKASEVSKFDNVKVPDVKR